jgi:hypothetical protein
MDSTYMEIDKEAGIKNAGVEDCNDDDSTLDNDTSTATANGNPTSIENDDSGPAQPTNDGWGIGDDW